MSVLDLPEILNVPDKLDKVLDQFNNYRYFLLEGGRGSGKSNTVARFLLYLGHIKSLRIFCGREIQASIEESVYMLLCDLIKAFPLPYDVSATKIDHPNGSAIRFKGFREQGSVNIKGIEGADIIWVEEAQVITKPTLDILIPTVRKEHSKVFFTMNRHLKDDPVYTMFKDRPDCLHIHIDYFENKFCPEALKVEADICRARNTEDYNHIWLGEPLPQANNAVFRGISDIVEKYSVPIAPQSTFEYSVGIDLAKSVDNTVLTVMNKQLKRVEYFERMESENKTSWSYQKEKIAAVSRHYNNALIVIDSTGVGDPIVEDLHRDGLNVYYHQKENSDIVTPGVKFNMINKERLIEKLKVAIELKKIKIPDIPVLIEELIAYESIALPSGNYRYSAPKESMMIVLFRLR